MPSLPKIIPAIIPQSKSDLLAMTKRLPTVSEWHIDVVDGKFVPTKAWPYVPSGRPAELVTELEKLSLEVDLMVIAPVLAGEAWVQAGVQRLVFHIETIGVEELRAFANQHKVLIGVCASLDTPAEKLLPYLELADYGQVMGIAKIGSQGQPFDKRALERIVWLRAVAPRWPISIDGSVNLDTLPRLVESKFDRYIVGSAVVGQQNPQRAYDELAKLLV